MRWSLALSFAFVLAACHSSQSTTCGTPSTGKELKAVIDKITLPLQRQDYAFDLNGDGKPDNQFGSIVGALAAQNIDLQTPLTSAITEGGIVLLIDTTGATLTDDACAQTTLSVGKATAQPPKFDGTDSFQIDPGFTAGVLEGPIAGGNFDSTNPATAPSDPVATIQLALLAATPISIRLHGVHVHAQVSSSGIMSGQLNGAIEETDVQDGFVAAWAQRLTAKVSAGTGMASTNQQILDVFDTGGTAAAGDNCMNTDGTPSCRNHAPSAADFGQCAKKGDKVISTCEVATNSIINNVLTADVQLFQNAPTYSPSAANTMKDSLSLGLSFSATQASY